MSNGPATLTAQRRVLGLFAKRPRPGEAKTRLAASTSPEWAAEVAAAFLHDIVGRLTLIHAHRVVAYAPHDAHGYFAGLVGDRFALVPQREGDLGRRLAAFFTAQLRAGAEAVVVVGTDSPTLPLAFIEQAFRELHRADVVLGPAMDGGYYLVGCSQQLPPIFEEIAWSSRQVLGDTIRRLADTNHRLALLYPWYDVDTLEDWQMLQGHLAALRRGGLDPEVPETERLAQAPIGG